MKNIKAISDKINTAVSYIGIIFFIVLIVACVAQVFFRFILNNSLSWTEELARYCFIWMHMIGTSLLIETKGHATVTVILDSLKGNAKKFLELIIEIVILLNGAFMAYTGFLLAQSSKANLSTALGIPMWIINISVAVGGILVIIQAIVQILLLFNKDEEMEGETA